MASTTTLLNATTTLIVTLAPPASLSYPANQLFDAHIASNSGITLEFTDHAGKGNGSATLTGTIIAPSQSASAFENVLISIYTSSGQPPLITPAIAALSVSSTTGTASSTVPGFPVDRNGTNPGTTTNGGESSTSAGQSTSTGTLPTPAPSPRVKDDAGKLAGVAIGCLIGGAILAALIVFLFMRRKQRRNGYRAAASPKTPDVHGEAVYLGKVGKAWEAHLPQSEADSTLRRSANGLLDQIELHVENFYGNSKVTPAINERMFAEQAGSRIVPQAVVTALYSSNRPVSLLKYIISRTVISKIDYQMAHTATLLPAGFGSLNIKANTANTRGFDQALSQWRVLTAYLSPSVDEDQQYQADRQQIITETAEKLCKLLDPWKTTNDPARQRNLEALLKRTSDLGIVLFSQPASFHWAWGNMDPQNIHDLDSLPREIIVLPGLQKESDQNGVPLASPLPIVEARLADWRKA